MPGGTPILPPVVLPEEDLDSTPRGLDGVSVGPGVGSYKVNGGVDGVMRETL